MDASQLGRCFDRHGADLRLYARQLLTDSEATDDAVQETFLRLACRGEHLSEEAVRPWLFATLRNLAIDQSRRIARRLRRERRVVDQRPASFTGEPGNRLDAALAEAALAELPAEQREVIVLRLWGGLTLAQIGAMLGLSTSAVFGRYQSGIQTLRHRLEGSSCANNR